jgi:hypothetical protein
VGLLQAMRTARFWLLFWVAALAIGSALVYTNNLGELVLALGGARSQQDSQVALFSVGSCMGRLAAGLVPERALAARGTPRTAFLVGAVLLEAAANLGAAYASSPGQLAAVSLLGGLALGGMWALLPVVASDLFGLGHVASVLGMLALAPAAGGYALSEAAGALYDKEAAVGAAAAGCAAAGGGCSGGAGPSGQAGGGGGGGGGLPLGAAVLAGLPAVAHRRHGECRGAHCFRSSFQALAALCLLAALLAWLLVLESAALYARVAQHLRAVRLEAQLAADEECGSDP